MDNPIAVRRVIRSFLIETTQGSARPWSDALRSTPTKPSNRLHDDTEHTLIYRRSNYVRIYPPTGSWKDSLRPARPNGVRHCRKRRWRYWSGPLARFTKPLFTEPF